MAKTNIRHFAVEFLAPNYDNTSNNRKVVGHSVVGTGYMQIEDNVDITNVSKGGSFDGVCTALYTEDGKLLPPDFVCEYRLKNGMTPVILPPTIKVPTL